MKKITFIIICSFVTSLTFAQLNVSITANPFSLCSGYQSILTANVTGGSQPYSYQWSNSLTTSSITVYPTPSSYTYSVTVTDNNSVSNSATISIDVQKAEIYSLTPVYSGDTVNFISDNSGNVVAWNWSCSPSIIPSMSPTFVIDSVPVTCCLIVTSNYGCMDTLCATAQPKNRITIANAFTPNGDGVNDIFKPHGNNFNSLHGSIFNRWGMKLYSWDDIYGGWDGKYNGNYVSSGAYFYIIVITFNDETIETRKGCVEVIRK